MDLFCLSCYSPSIVQYVYYRFDRILTSQIPLAGVNSFVNAKESGKLFSVLSKHVEQCAGLNVFKLDHSLKVFFLTPGAVTETLQFLCKCRSTRERGKTKAELRNLFPKRRKGAS